MMQVRNYEISVDWSAVAFWSIWPTLAAIVYAVGWYFADGRVVIAGTRTGVHYTRFFTGMLVALLSLLGLLILIVCVGGAALIASQVFEIETTEP